MDIVYSYPDVLSYASFRHSNFAVNEYAVKADTPKTDKNGRSGQKSDCKTSKETCPICQERRRRPLAKYIQQKSREERTKDACIQEEEETEADSKPTAH